MLDRLERRPDILSAALHDARLGGHLTSRTRLYPPFALAFSQQERRVGFHICQEGCGVVLLDGRVLSLSAGDLVLFPTGAPHVVADQPDTPAVPVEQVSVVPAASAPGGPSTVLLCGAYDVSAGAAPLLHGLPDVVHLRGAAAAGSALGALLRLLIDEAGAGHTGGQLVQGHLVDVVFVLALREGLVTGGEASTWIGALSDPALGQALRAIHDDPAAPWTLVGLAARAGQSRAVFARRFREAVGEPPMTYLIRLRMGIAARRLEEGASIAEAAAAVGYQSPFAFARAFKRTSGLSPGAHRRQAKAP